MLHRHGRPAGHDAGGAIAVPLGGFVAQQILNSCAILKHGSERVDVGAREQAGRDVRIPGREVLRGSAVCHVYDQDRTVLPAAVIQQAPPDVMQLMTPSRYMRCFGRSDCRNPKLFGLSWRITAKSMRGFLSIEAARYRNPLAGNPGPLASIRLRSERRCHCRTASVTPAMTSTSDAICGNSSGSPSAAADAMTPTIGVNSMPIAAVPAATRRNAANQVR